MKKFLHCLLVATAISGIGMSQSFAERSAEVISPITAQMLADTLSKVLPPAFAKKVDTNAFNVLSAAVAGKQPAGNYATTSAMNAAMATKLNAADTAALRASINALSAQMPSYTAGPGINIASNVISTNPTAILLGTITIGQTAAVAISAGPRLVTITGVTGLLANDRILVTPSGSLPSGYLIGDAFCAVNGTLNVNIYGPLLAIGASYTFSAKVTLFR